MITKSRKVNDSPNFVFIEKELELITFSVGYIVGSDEGTPVGDELGCVGFVVGNDDGCDDGTDVGCDG